MAKSGTKSRHPAWAVTRMKMPNGDVVVRVRCPTKDREGAIVTFPIADLRHRGRLLDQFASKIAEYPASIPAHDDARFDFIKGLVEADSSPIELLPDRSGFLDASTFVTHSEVIRADGTHQVRHRLTVEDITDHIGTLARYTSDVLLPAQQSSYLTLAIGISLASPLPNYLKLSGNHRFGNSHLSETAAFNLSGVSSSGKTNVGLAALAATCSPKRAGTMNFSERGLAEAANESNDMLLMLDDTEKNQQDQVRALRALVHAVPSGKSKMISRSLGQSPIANLQWTTMCLSSSPLPIRQLAAQNGWVMTRGDLVRLFDIAVPPPERGGIFDRIGWTAKRKETSAKLISKLERGYWNNSGHLFAEWMSYLLKKDRSKTIFQYIDQFVGLVGATDHGWEKRFALKFAIVYAAARLGAEAKLLPWREDHIRKSVIKCYRAARYAAESDEERAPRLVADLAELLSESHRVKEYLPRATEPLKISDGVIAISFSDGGCRKFGLLDDALTDVVGSRARRTDFISALRSARLLSGGADQKGTVQRRMPIVRNGMLVPRPRLWIVDAKDLAHYLHEL